LLVAAAVHSNLICSYPRKSAFIRGNPR